MRFEWDEAKASKNYEKHRIRFETAITAFDDPFALIAPDAKHSTPLEEREWLIGEADGDLVIVVIFTRRHQRKIVRLISARPASRKERRTYENYKIFPIS